MSKVDFPELPAEQRRFTSGEVCTYCCIEKHTLRYWSKIYARLVKAERVRNRSYYTRADILSLRQIKTFHQQGLTTDAIKKLLAGDGTAAPDLPTQIIAGNKLRTQLNQIIKILE